MIFVDRRQTSSFDSDAAAYLALVEAADGQALEAGVRDAINAFFVGCKADGIWSALKAACILAGARTRAGALVPLVGTAPSSTGFVDADYNRETGLLGAGNNTKFLNSNRLANTDPAGNSHASAYITTADTRDTSQSHMGSGTTSGHVNLTASSTNRTYSIKTGSSNVTITGKATGFYGLSRPNTSDVAIRTNGSAFSTTLANGTSRSSNILVFGNGNTYTDARISFYSIGEALDLALLDARLITLMSALAAAIP